MGAKEGGLTNAGCPWESSNCGSDGVGNQKGRSLGGALTPDRGADVGEGRGVLRILDCCMAG